MTTNNFPYFDYIFKQLSKGEDQTHQVFNKHVHWGYWEDPDEASLTHEDFVTAQKRLSH